MKELCDFLREKRQLLFFLLFFEGSLCLTYGLYGLPWGPAGYTCLVTAVVTLGFLMAGFFRWKRKRRQLLILKRQAEQSLETADLPKAETPLEKIYQEIIRDQEKRCQREQKESREKLARSREYYTRWSHQIKTPIAAMELLLQEEPADVRALKRELLKTSQYVEMALSYQRMEGEGNDLVIQRYELRPVVMQAVKKVSPLLIHKHISFSAGDLSGEVLTDEKWLVFVLEQLLTNASKYTKEGGSVRIGKENGLLVLRDTGIGIRPEDLPRIFEWGYTGYNGRLDKRSTGVGLALVKQVMEMLGNKIEIRSVLGEGTEVFLDLRRTELEAE
ncbi:MAG: sensor histidine kinase [Blautia sp.]